MRAISLWQPWASAIAVGAKRVETRSWSTSYRGRFAIHAAKRLNIGELIHFSCCWNWCGALQPTGLVMGGGSKLDRLLPFGALVATARLVDCRPTGSFTLDELDAPREPQGINAPHLYRWTERQMGDFGLGRFGWILEDVRPLEVPVPWRGAQGFFNVPDEVLVPAVARSA
jgi:activating signal cointegrator 1